MDHLSSQEITSNNQNLLISSEESLSISLLLCPIKTNMVNFNVCEKKHNLWLKSRASYVISH